LGNKKWKDSKILGGSLATEGKNGGNSGAAKNLQGSQGQRLGDFLTNPAYGLCSISFGFIEYTFEVTYQLLFHFLVLSYALAFRVFY